MLLLLVGPTHAGTPDYKLGSDDLVSVSVFDHPELSTSVRISKSGNITFPLLGQVPASGLSTRELEELLNRRLAEGGYVRNPQVAVLVTDYQSQKVSVMGQVNKPGEYALTKAVKVLNLLAQAGGLVTGIPGGTGNDMAGDTATLIRQDGTKVSIDLHGLFEGDPSQNPDVAGGDTIYVPKAPIYYIYGEVQKPGAYKLERNMTITQAIAAGGGLGPKGSDVWIKVKRRDTKGVVHNISVKGRDLLQPDDVLVIKEAWF
jgi:polysaccharide export outer membrane protein